MLKNCVQNIEFFHKQPINHLQNAYFDKQKYEEELKEYERELQQVDNRIRGALLGWERVGEDIYPTIYNGAFQENLPIEKFEKVFKFNAESLMKNIKFDIPISIDEAWNKIVEYKTNNGNRD